MKGARQQSDVYCKKTISSLYEALVFMDSVNTLNILE